MAEELELLVNKIKRRKEENFKTTKITSLISELEEDGLMTENEYFQIVNLFYDTFIDYLKKWAYPFQSLKPFKWVQLKISSDTDTMWRFFQESLKSVSEVDQNIFKIINEDELFDEVSCVKDLIENKSVEWRTKTELYLGEKWRDILFYLRNEGICFKNLSLLVEFALALPGTNAEVEMFFSVVNALWTNEKSRFKVETVKAMIVVKTHFQEVSYTDFYNTLKENTKLLEDIQSSAKYQTGAADTSEPQAPEPCSSSQ